MQKKGIKGIMREEGHGRGYMRLRKLIALLMAADVILLAACIVLLLHSNAIERKYMTESQASVDNGSMQPAAVSETGTGMTEASSEASTGSFADTSAAASASDESGSTGDAYLDGVKALAENGASAIDILKYLFPKKIVVADEGTYHFFDINDSLKKNVYPEANYSLSNDMVTYSENGQKVSVLGVDVSQHNGDIDWEKVKASGVDFAYIRAGIRGYGSGKLVEDTTYEANITAAKAAGLHVGVYFATQALNEAEAKEEADYVLQLISGKGVDCPVAIDIEKIEEYDTTPRTLGLTKDQYTANVKAFLEEIRNGGYDAMIYGNAKTFTMMLNMEQVEDYEKWFADYITPAVYTPEFPYAFRIWQFTCNGKCDGINGTCDYNIAYY